jgi:hypothetical protein
MKTKHLLALILVIATSASAQVAAPDKSLWDTETVQIKIMEQNSQWWRFSYLITVRNPHPNDCTRTYQVQLLDKDGFEIESAYEYKVTTSGNSTNTIRGAMLVTLPKAATYKSAAVQASKRLKP